MGIAREHYLTAANRESRAAQWLQACGRAAREKPPILDFKQTALLVLDMQGFFLDADAHAFVPSSDAILPPIAAMVDSFYRRDGTVVFTRHVSSENPDDPMRKRWPRAMSATDPFSPVSPRLDTSRATLLTKSAFSAFRRTDLETRLRSRGISRIIISGVMTHLCCDTTARDAFMRGFDVMFTVDGTATYTESLHLGSLLALSHGFAACISSEEVPK